MNETNPSAPSTPPVSLIPLYDHILILPDKPAETYGTGGIHIPEVHRNPVPMGTVIATGEGHLCTHLPAQSRDSVGSCHIEPLRVKVGDRVLYSKHSGTEIRLSPDPKSQHYFLLRESEVLGIIKT
jgi:chaperonin GroES